MQNKREVIINPLDLSEFGKTPYGPKYRIVRADTRIDTLVLDGKMHKLPRYSNYGRKWVMEKHLPVEQYLGMSREQWDALFSGPMFGHARPEYPIEGDYEYVYDFDGAVDPVQAYKIAALIEFDQNNFTDADRTKALLAAEEDKHRAQDEQKIEKILAYMDRPAEEFKEPTFSIPRPSATLNKESK